MDDFGYFVVAIVVCLVSAVPGSSPYYLTYIHTQLLGIRFRANIRLIYISLLERYFLLPSFFGGNTDLQETFQCYHAMSLNKMPASLPSSLLVPLCTVLSPA